MRTVAIVAARTNSTRLKGKVLFDLGGQPVLRWVIRAAEAAVGVDEVYVATTTEKRDDAIVEACYKWRIPCWRGSETDVLKRFADCARHAKADLVVRLTGDCCFADPEVIGAVIALQRRTGADYAQNVSPATFPDGLDVELVTAEALYAADAEATRPTDRDCLTQYIERNRLRWRNEALICPIPGLHRERIVLDTIHDFQLCQAIVERLSKHIPYRPPSYLEILQILDNEPELCKINSMWQRNSRFYEALVGEQS